MAATYTLETRTVPGASFLMTTDITGDGSYPTGGYTVTPQNLGFAFAINQIIECRARNIASILNAPLITPTTVNGIITKFQFQLVVQATGAEVANGTNVTTMSYIIEALGY